jgi:D-alanyl-lipoteichoic acid acyltransferase DltB (MBOAT superfamily)
MKNFSFPYFSRDIAEFWRRWHISLTSWFRDYLYIPLGGSRGSKLNQIRNVFIVFIVSGFWHGANWTFIIWGVVNAILFLPLLLRNTNRNNIDVVAKGRYLPSLKEAFSMLGTFLMTMLAWVFFRAESVSHALSYFKGILNKQLFVSPQIMGHSSEVKNSLIFISFFIIIEWLGRENNFAIEKIELKLNRAQRWIFYTLLLLLIGTFMPSQQNPFIYFQF